MTQGPQTLEPAINLFTAAWFGRGWGHRCMHNRKPLFSAGHLTLGLLCVVALVTVSSACAADRPHPSTSPASVSATAAPSAADETPNASVPPADLGWYEASRTLGPGGTETRTLYVGSLGGDLVAAIKLGTLETAQRNGVTASFEWIFPQAEGIFDDTVLIWERQEGSASVEAVSVADGSVRALIDIDDPVHVATADAGLQRIFFVTADAASSLPTGLWADDLGDAAGPERIAYRFADEPLSNAFKYRLTANADGSLLAIQAEDGPVTLIDVARRASVEVSPGGPMIAFSEAGLVAYGPRPDTSLLLIDVDTRAERVLVDEVDAAQLVKGTEGDLVAFMQIDPLDPRSFVIGVVSPRTGGRGIAYTQDPSVVGPLLARRDQIPLGSEAPPDSVLVGTFLTFIEGLAPLADHPLDSYPMLLDLRTGETQRVGPFSEGGGG